jgi:hypothetical protein
MGKLKAKAMEMAETPVPVQAGTTLPAQSGGGAGNLFAAYGDAAGGGGRIVGELLKFSKGDFLAGQDSRLIPQGSKLVAVMDTLEVGWQRWENQRPVSFRMGLLIEGFTPPSRQDLGDNDSSLWETDDDGEPRDPWQATNYLRFVDLNNKDRLEFTFTTSSKGGLGAVAKLCREYGRAVEKEGRAEQYPIVRLDVESYAHRDRSLGRIKFPSFAIIGWVDKNLTPVRDSIGDTIPF